MVVRPARRGCGLVVVKKTTLQKLVMPRLRNGLNPPTRLQAAVHGLLEPSAVRRWLFIVADAGMGKTTSGIWTNGYVTESGKETHGYDVLFVSLPEVGFQRLFAPGGMGAYMVERLRVTQDDFLELRQRKLLLVLDSLDEVFAGGGNATPTT